MLNKRILCILVSFIFCLSLVAFPSSASIKPNYSAYEYGDAYKTSNYYDQLLEAKSKLTGDHRYDVILIALSQIGYHEGNSDADMGGGNLDGHKNFAEYNRMYGKLDNGEGNGMSYGYSWCAAFVSWCLRQARVAESTIPTFVSCSRAVKDFRSRGMFKEAKSGYIPQTGDIIFFIKRFNYSFI